MDSIGLLGAAVTNNASWCDAVCRSHGYPGAFSGRLWSSTRHRLRFYPNVITLSPEVTAQEVLAAAARSQPLAVKDSFARLDLAPAGFRLLAEASWIVRDAGPAGPAQPAGSAGRPDDGLSWDRVTSSAELRDWERAWAGVNGDDGDDGDGDGDGNEGDGRVFQPGLLSDPRCTILAGRRQDAVIAGAVVYAADGAVGISNRFSAGPSAHRVWAGLQLALAGLRPRLPLVGYEAGASLDAARRAGFRTLGALRIWVRPSSAP